MIGKGWHKNIDPSLARLGEHFCTSPICVIGGARFNPRPSTVNEFALALTMAEDHLSKRVDYDFFAGAMVVPQVAKLGSKLKTVLRVGGDVKGKIQELLRHPGGDPSNTVFELLTAAAFHEKGYDPSFVPTGRSKTPDIAVTLGDVECYVECKRKARFSGYESDEAIRMLAVFERVREQISKTISGVFDLRFFWLSEEIPVSSIVDACVKATHHVGSVYYSWGSCVFKPLPEQLEVSATRLYSPRYIHDITGYEMDGCQQDGLVLQVAGSNEFEVDCATHPLAITWTSLSVKARERKARAVAALFGKAVSQFPSKSIGFPYICYVENNGDSLADMRTMNLIDELEDSYHRASIAVPATFVSRLYAVPDEHGNPNLIENAMQFRAAYFPDFSDLDFPTLIFTEH